MSSNGLLLLRTLVKNLTWKKHKSMSPQHFVFSIRMGQICLKLSLFYFCFFLYWKYPVNKYMLKFNNRNTRKKYETCSKLTIATPKQYYWHHSGVFIVIFEQTLYLGLVITLLILKRLLPAGRFFQITFS